MHTGQLSALSTSTERAKWFFSHRIKAKSSTRFALSSMTKANVTHSTLQETSEALLADEHTSG